MTGDRGGTDAVGLWGEKLAERMLSKKGYRILGRRVRLDARSEIDVVGRDGDVLVFVEVRTRATETYGRPHSSIDREKRRAISRAAVRYLKRKSFPDVPFRFDVVEVIGSMGDADPTVRHIENAFALDKRYSLP